MPYETICMQTFINPVLLLSNIRCNVQCNISFLDYITIPTFGNKSTSAERDSDSDYKNTHVMTN